MVVTNSFSSPLSEIQFYGSYSRMKDNGQKEDWGETCDRTLHNRKTGLFAIANYTEEEEDLIEEMLGDELCSLKALGSGRWLWCGGTDWLDDPKNWHGAFNCVTLNLDNLEAFGLSMNLSACGCGVGVNLETRYIEILPPVVTIVNLTVVGKPFLEKGVNYNDNTIISSFSDREYFISVGDSRLGWCQAYQSLINLATTPHSDSSINVTVDLSRIRCAGTPLKGFGGVANPEGFPRLLKRIVAILNSAIGRKLNSLECSLLVDEAGLAIVAGGIRRVAGIRQGDAHDADFINAKKNLWTFDDGNWKIDPEKEALKVANHTRIFHHIPTVTECIAAVRSQFFSGEGAIQWAGEAVARCSADTLNTKSAKQNFLDKYPDRQLAAEYLADRYFITYQKDISSEELADRMSRYGLNPCGELVANNNHCNLATVHLTNINPNDIHEQEKAFQAATLSAVALLHQNFEQEVFAKSRDYDPVIIISFTQGFEFFARLLGIDWLSWWQAGRLPEWSPSRRQEAGGRRQEVEGSFSPTFLDTVTVDFPNADFSEYAKVQFGYLSEYFLAIEARYLKFWKTVVERTAKEYCSRNGIKCPNRCTGLKPEGSLTLLTGTGMCGLHPPKSWRYIRRKEVPKNSPLALAAIDYGFTVMPSNGDKDELGNLLNDPYSPLCRSWVIEAPVEEKLVTLIPEIEQKRIDPSQFSALAQMNWIMQIQNCYSTHNTSCTPEIREHEIEEVGTLIHQLITNQEGYVSMAFLARYDDHQTFPRMPFEPISKEEFEQLRTSVLQRRKSDSFTELFLRYMQPNLEENPLDTACDSAVCNS